MVGLEKRKRSFRGKEGERRGREGKRWRERLAITRFICDRSFINLNFSLFFRHSALLRICHISLSA